MYLYITEEGKSLNIVLWNMVLLKFKEKQKKYCTFIWLWLGIRGRKAGRGEEEEKYKIEYIEENTQNKKKKDE